MYYTINEETISNYGFIKEILEKEMRKIDQCGGDSKMLVLFKENNINCENIECGKTIIENEKCK
ncbi:MAG: ArsR family transcriptional regulator [Clostridium sp.]